MIFLLFAIVCSSTIVIIFKFSEQKNSNRFVVTSFNYIAACLISFYMLPHKQLFLPEWFYAFNHEVFNVLSNGDKFSLEASAGWAVILGVITGVIFFLGFWLYQFNVNKNGAALSATFMKLGILIPVLLSIFFFNETPTAIQLIGIMLAVVAIIIINLQIDKGVVRNFKLELLILFIIGGVGDFNSKVYQNFGQLEYTELFIFYIFVSALIVSLIMLFIKDRKVRISDLMIGLAVGIPNQLTSYLLIKSLESLKASLTFPIFSAGTILFVNLVNIAVLKEKLSRKQYIAMGIIIVSLILLNI